MENTQVQLMSGLIPIQAQKQEHRPTISVPSLSPPPSTSLVQAQPTSQKVRKSSGGNSENTNQLGGKFVNG